MLLLLLLLLLMHVVRVRALLRMALHSMMLPPLLHRLPPQSTVQTLEL